MKLIIDIDEDDYNWIKDDEDGASNYAITIRLYNAIDKGTPLPKGYGRLGDLDALEKEITKLRDGHNYYGNECEVNCYLSYDVAVNEVIDAPTIIPADKNRK